MENLVNCEDCGKSVSRRALACPNCGSPIQEQNLDKETLVEEPVKELAVVTLKKYVEPVHVESNLEKAFAWLPAVIAALFLIFTMSISMTAGSVLFAILAIALLSPPFRNKAADLLIVKKHYVSIIAGAFIVASLIVAVGALPEPSPETVAARKAERASQEEAKSLAADTSKAMLVTKCELVIKPQLKNPKSMNVDFSTTRDYSTSTGFNLEMSYYAENSFGANMINKALCEFDENGTLINVTSLE